MDNEIKQWEKGLDYFKKNKLLSNYIKEIDLSFLKQKSHLKTLIGIIIGQQISTTAAKSIKSNFFKNLKIVNPEIVLEILKTKKNFGLSKNKCKTIKLLSKKLISNKRFLCDLKSKEQIDSIASLTTIWGIGNWTAKMFLIFGLNRIDIFINEDFGIKKSIEKIYGRNFILQKLEDEFKPYRSIATLLLWKHLEKS
jgi:DNA-3-methyladenine glycosylase II